MKKQTYVVKIEMPDGDMISPGWLQDLIQQDCNSEGNEDRQKVSVQECPSPSNLDEAAEEFYPDFSDSIVSKAAVDSMRDAFKAGVEWMAGQGVSIDGKVIMDFSNPADIINRRLIAKVGDALLEIEPGDVVVQIRKK